MRVKRTYNLSPEVVALVKRMVEDDAAPSQDALIESSVRMFERHLRDMRDYEAWERAASDPEFLAEAARLETEFAPDDVAAFSE